MYRTEGGENVHYLRGGMLADFIAEYCEDNGIVCDADFMNIAFGSQARPISEYEAAMRIEETAHVWHLYGCNLQTKH